MLIDEVSDGRSLPLHCTFHVLCACLAVFAQLQLRSCLTALLWQVHLLSENRGSALETGTISRIKMVSSKKEMSLVC